MKIKLYELRPDEQVAFSRAAAALPDGYSIDAVAEPLSAENIDALAGYEAIVITNKSLLTADIVARLQQLGVRYVSSRCKCKPAIWRMQVNDYSLEGLLGRELRTMTVGVMGTGRIGRAVIDYLGGFGCKILAYDPYPAQDLAAREGVEYVGLDELYRDSDLITVHVPLMDSTRDIIDAGAIAKMKDGVVLINVSRGELVDTDALIDAVESEKVGALAMDVFEDEGGIYHENRMNDIISNRKMAYLRQFPNVLLTNHIAFYTDVDVDSMVEDGIANIPAMVEGRCTTEL